MSTKRSAGPSPEGIARSERQRAAAEEGAKAMADAERQSFDVRKNMARLRELREAKEIADAAARASLPAAVPKKRAKKSPQ
ncbi:transcriptional regulator [Bradyrhizobium betae]|jgi:hypothetical protein|uniref:transcriptional regulator n=1 Tax=Bradyrhizobium betae TaxID=244734 RepID=UPI003D673E58